MPTLAPRLRFGDRDHADPPPPLIRRPRSCRPSASQRPDDPLLTRTEAGGWAAGSSRSWNNLNKRRSRPSVIDRQECALSPPTRQPHNNQPDRRHSRQRSRRRSRTHPTCQPHDMCSQRKKDKEVEEEEEDTNRLQHPGGIIGPPRPFSSCSALARSFSCRYGLAEPQLLRRRTVMIRPSNCAWSLHAQFEGIITVLLR